MPRDANPVRPTLNRLACLATLAAIAAIAAACGHTEETPDSPTPDAAGDETPTPPDISGRWTSGCLDFTPEGGDPNIFQLDFDLTADRWAIDYVVHGAPDCSAPLLTVHIDGPYALTAPSETVEGAWEADFRFDEKTMTPHVDGMVQTLSSIEGCGDGPFALDEATSVLGAGCAPFGQYPGESCSQDYDLVLLSADGQQLRFGNRPADNNMCTPDRRPSEPSPVVLTRP